MARIAALAALLGSCTTGVTAIRGHEFADLNLEEESGTCKRWCSVMDFATFNSFNGDVEKIKAKADEKCVKSECKGCVRAPGDVSKPHCLPPVLEPIKEPEVVTEKVVQETTTAVPEEDPALPGEVCQLVDAPWCPAPARNPGQKYRKGNRPVCCSKVADSNMEGAKEAAEKIEEVEIATQRFLTEEPATPTETPAPVPEAISEPVCGDGPFAPEEVQKDGRTVSLCRDTVTKLFAKNFCCEAAALQLLKDKEAASQACAQVEKAHCKDSPLVFEKKRNHYAVPASYTCVRMYLCTDGKLEFGPVKNQALCMASATNMPKNLPANRECVAIKK